MADNFRVYEADVTGQPVATEQLASGAHVQIMRVRRHELSDIDDAGSPAYYGFVDADGGWYIKRVTSTTVRFVRGSSGYAAAWTGRAGQTYGLYSDIF